MGNVTNAPAPAGSAITDGARADPEHVALAGPAKSAPSCDARSPLQPFTGRAPKLLRVHIRRLPKAALDSTGHPFRGRGPGCCTTPRFSGSPLRSSASPACPSGCEAACECPLNAGPVSIIMDHMAIVVGLTLGSLVVLGLVLVPAVWIAFVVRAPEALRPDARVALTRQSEPTGRGTGSAPRRAGSSAS
jgi:hypothetical protein